jgi:hypothetical protein
LPLVTEPLVPRVSVSLWCSEREGTETLVLVMVAVRVPPATLSLLDSVPVSWREDLGWSLMS